MTLVTVSLTNAGALEIACTACGLRDRRTLTAADYTRLRGWQDSYTSAVRAGSKTEVLLAIGRDVHSWLDGSTRVLQSITEAQSPYVFEYRVARAVNEDGEAFLHAPWELLADENGFWAGRIDRLYFPVRRLGAPALGGSKAPSPYALSLLFMAAAPEGADNLEFEAEETAVVRATAGLELDLIVEESGTLELLQVRAAEHSPDVVHISCHGTAKPNPALLLEDEGGAPVRVGASELVVGLGGALPRLLFLSACETAQAGQASGNAVLPSLTVSLLHAGAPAVLGWAAPVLDSEATQFAAELYRRLTLNEALEKAVGWARFRLLNPAGEERPAGHWHLARLVIGPEGGGKLATGANGSRVSQGAANRAFLNRKLAQVPVASSSEFVGRRRKLQQILREMNSPAHAGVLIHGLGRQGKSSLAARVADRLEDRRYAVAVVHGAYSTPDILSAIRDASPGSQAVERIARAGRDIETPEQLERALEGLLEGPCGHYEEEHGRAIRKPLLLIIDDMEQVLEISGGSARALFKTSEAAGVLTAVIRAFDRACPRSRSRLLFTSRFEFTLQADGVELADRLLSVQLPPMPAAESERQLAARGRTIETKDRAAAVGRIAQRSERIVAAGLGSPGLQELLTGLAVEDEARCDRCLGEMVRLKAGKMWPEEQVLQDFMQQIVLKQIADALTQKQRELFRASTLFNMPIPEAVLLEIAGRAFITSDPDDVARLIALGAWDVFGDSSREFAPAPLLLPLFAPLKHDEVTALAAIAVRPLFMAWGGAEGGSTRPAVQDLELTRLSIFGNDTAVLASCARYAVRLMMNRGDMSAAANLGAAAIDTMDRAGGGPPLELLWAAAESQAFVGDADDAKQNLDRALQSMQVTRAGGKPIDPNTHGGVLLEHARLLVSQGDPDSALAEFEEAGTILPGERERAIVRGQIADILQSRGDLDEALRIRREEQLPVYERLSDVRSRAVTMGKIADILQSRGDLDEALRIRREEELPVYERLGDVRSRAVTMGQIADILQSRGDLDEALRIRREEQLPVYERLGDVRERAVTMGQIADILQSRGDLDEALRIRREEELPVYERLGDVRELLVGRTNFAILLAQRGRKEDAQEIAILLRQAFQAAERMGLPEAKQIAEIAGNIFGEEMADILLSAEPDSTEPEQEV